MNTHEARVQVFQAVVGILVDACEPEDSKERSLLTEDMTILAEDLFDSLLITVVGVGQTDDRIHVDLQVTL